MAETPADVYRDAAKAYVGMDETCDAASRHTRATLVALWTRDERFRAALHVAYRRGQASREPNPEIVGYRSVRTPKGERIAYLPAGEELPDGWTDLGPYPLEPAP